MDYGRTPTGGPQNAPSSAPAALPKGPIITQALAVAAVGLMVGCCMLAMNDTANDQATASPWVDPEGPQLSPRHEAMDFDMAVALVNERSYAKSGGIEIVALTASDFRNHGQSIVSHQLTSDAGKAVSAPMVGELKNRLAKQETSAEKTAIKQPLKDGYYKVRSIGVGADTASSTVAQVESYFLIQDGELFEVDANQWFENSLANQAHGG